MIHRERHPLPVTHGPVTRVTLVTGTCLFVYHDGAQRVTYAGRSRGVRHDKANMQPRSHTWMWKPWLNTTPSLAYSRVCVIYWLTGSQCCSSSCSELICVHCLFLSIPATVTAGGLQAGHTHQLVSQSVYHQPACENSCLMFSVSFDRSCLNYSASADKAVISALLCLNMCHYNH